MSTATDMLAHYLSAEAAVLSGQIYRWGDRQLTRANLAEITAGRREWERKVVMEQRGGAPIGVMLANFTGCGSAPEGGASFAEDEYVWPFVR